MSTFLDDLERELLAAHPRRRSARRRATAGRIAATAPLVLVVLLTLAGAGAFLLSVGGEDAARPGATSPEPPPPAGFAADLPMQGVAVLNGTAEAGLGRKVADLLGTGGSARPRDTVENAPPPTVRRTRVEYADGHREAARRVAFRLRAIARPIDADLRAIAGDAAIVVVVGEDLRRVRSGTLRSPTEGGRARGIAGIVERDGNAVVSVDAAPSPGSVYAIWMLTERGSATLVGFAAEPLRPQRRLHGTREMRIPSGVRKIIVTRETNPQPRRPARPVLEATLR